METFSFPNQVFSSMKIIKKKKSFSRNNLISSCHSPRDSSKLNIDVFFERLQG